MGRQYIKWDITSRCNLRCRHCSVGKAYFQTTQAELSLDQKLAVVERLSSAGVQAVSLLGGDPLVLKEDLFAVCSLAASRGMAVSVVTNGLLLTGSTVDRLIDCGLKRIVVSLDGACRETHEFVRGGGTFERVVANVGGLTRRIEQRGSALRVNVNTVLNQRNYSEAPAMIDLCMALGVHEWTPLSLVSIGFAEEGREDLNLTAEQEIEAARLIAERCADGRVAGRLEIQLLFTYPLVCDYVKAKYGLSLPKPRICCNAAIGLGFVSPDGNLYPCDRIATTEYRGSSIGDAPVHPVSLVEHSFDEAFNSDYFRNMFGFIASDDTYRDYVPCRRCGYFRTRFCNPCPLYSLHSKVLVRSCSIAERGLGDISVLGGEEASATASAGEVAEHAAAAGPARPTYNIRSSIPSKVTGLRWAEKGTDLLIFDPVSVHFTSVNLSGRAVWELIDGRRTVAEIARELEEVASELRRAVSGFIVPGSTTPLDARVSQFVDALCDRGLVSLGETDGAAVPHRSSES